MKKLFRKIHLWLSVPFGIVITLISFSGAMLVFEEEIMHLLHRDLYFAEHAEDAVPLSVGELAAKVAATLPEGVKVTGVTLFADPGRTCMVNLSEPRRASVAVNPYTGEVTGRVERAPFFACMFRLHRWLLDGMRPGGGIFVGKLVVGISTLLFVVILLSGVVIWWPRTRKAMRNSLKISVRKGWRRFWYGLHVAGGMYALLFLLAMASTGLTWSFPWYRNGFYRLFGVETTQGGGHGARPSAKTSGGRAQSGKPSENASGYKHEVSFVRWQQVCEELARRNPSFRQITVSDGAAGVSSGRTGNRRASDRYLFDPESGEITKTMLYEDTARANKIRGWIFSVHVGSWGGLPTRILAFVAALAGATLPLTGYYLWFRRLKRRKS